MNRLNFIKKLTALGVCPLVIQNLASAETLASNPAQEEKTQDEKLNEVLQQKQFVENWLSDLLESMEKNLDRGMQEKIVGGCGVACFNKHQFKKDIAIAGSGNLDNLIESYKKNFEIWKDNNTVHIRYGEVSSYCYCPAANYRASKPNDIHCECTRNTHKTIFETALSREFNVEIVESLRRGGKTCHFIVHLS